MYESHVEDPEMVIGKEVQRRVISTFWEYPTWELTQIFTPHAFLWAFQNSDTH